MHESAEHDIFGGGEGSYPRDASSLTTIGIDVGSTTFHFIFARVHFGAPADGDGASGARREILWRSPIYLTPYRGNRIDAESVGLAVELGHKAARISPESIDSGAVILTGEALRAENAHALASSVAATAGKFVSISAGHHLEAMLAAFGSGAVGATHDHENTLLHVDIGGGTTKFAVIDGHGIRQTAAINGGGRLVTLDDKRRIVRVSAGARQLRTHDHRIELVVGKTLKDADAKRLAEALADAIVGVINKDTEGTAEPLLRLTPALDERWEPRSLSFSGGVSEYIYGREDHDYGDIGRFVAAAIKDRLDDGRISLPVIDPGEGIRATVIGAAQSTTHVSGHTVSISTADLLPLLDIPVIHPHFHGTDVGATDVARGISRELALYGLTSSDAVALSMSFAGSASYDRLRELAKGIGEALGHERTAPAVILLDKDIAASLGPLVEEELPNAQGIVCLDGLHLSPLDYVDVGQALELSGVFPVVVKSLLFDVHQHQHLHHEHQQSAAHEEEESVHVEHG